MNKLTTLLLNWKITTYHAPILLAKSLGYFERENIDIAILEPSDPSDVTRIVGTQGVDFALKAFVHCFAARERGFTITSVATVFDEPPSGVLSLSCKPIRTAKDMLHKRIGFVGEFGKCMLEDIAKNNGIAASEIEFVRVGMHGLDALMHDRIDAFIGIDCIQGIELAARDKDYCLLRIDALADLGCCCFCSIALIAHDDVIEKDPITVTALCTALFKAMQFVVDNPEISVSTLRSKWPTLNTDNFDKSFYHCLPYFSRHLENVARDWEKVACYAQRLGIFDDQKHSLPFTNKFLNHLGSSRCNRE